MLVNVLEITHTAKRMRLDWNVFNLFKMMKNNR